MRRTYLTSAAAAALIATVGIASAQTPGNAPNSPGASQSAPSATPATPSERAAPANRGDAAGSKMQGEGGQHAQDQKQGGKAASDKAASDTNMEKSGGMKADQRNAAERDKSDQKNAADRDGMKSDQKNAGENKAGTTVGQAGAGAKLTTEQRTTIRTSITKQNIRPATNINFSVNVGTRVPRTVGFHPLPTEVVTIYPDWRGYEFFLVNDQIVVVNPRTLEIVAVLDA